MKGQKKWKQIQEKYYYSRDGTYILSSETAQNVVKVKRIH